MKRTWIKLYVDQTLRGSMIEELTPDQRWMFVGLLLMAGFSIPLCTVPRGRLFSMLKGNHAA